MSNVNTFNGLIAAITSWTNRNDAIFISNIPLFISLAEQQFFIDCSTLGNESYVTGTFNAANESVPKPAMWGQTLTFSYIDSLGNIVILERSTYEFIRSLAPASNIIPTTALPTTQAPKYYSDYGYNYFIISPTPQAALTYEIAYFQKIQPLSLTNQSNWITQYAYDALFWSCLDKAYRFLDNVADADTYQQKYQDRIAAINEYNKGRKWDRTADATKD
jgi:hypothetical protein